jgi:tetratricopeptide (TPR) repeat protein
MNARTLVLGVAASLLAAGVVLFVAAHPAEGRATPDRRAAVLEERRIHELDIQFYLERAARDPQGAADRVTLAGLYLQHARETGSYEDYPRAEQYARTSLGMRHQHNARAFALLASALLAQHRFEEARVAAESLVSWEPWVPSHRAMLGEIAFEMGRYDQARELFDSLRHDAARLDVAPRLARWAELNGHTESARLLLRNAYADARRLKHLPREQVAWFALREGDFEFRAGNLDEAQRLYEEGLGIVPDDYRLEAALARLMLERGDPAGAVRHGEAALQVVLEPATLGVLADAWLALGDSAKAEEYVHVMRVALGGQSGPLHRQWELFLLDHHLDVDQIAQRAREELRGRRDVYGFDVMAWALFRQGHLGEARAAMDSALRLGTRDPLLARHRAAIDSALAGENQALPR